MKPPLDKWSRDYGALLEQQSKDLLFMKSLVRPEVYADLEQYCRSVNQPVTDKVMEVRESLKPYKAGGIHVCPIGYELFLILQDRQRYQEGVEYILRSNEAVVAQAREALIKQKRNHQQHIMKHIATKFVAIAALCTEIAEALDNLPASGGGGDIASDLAALAAKKDPKLVSKVLGKFGAEFEDGEIKDLEEKDFEKAKEKLEALDDVEGGGDESGDKEITLDVLTELAQELVSDGKADEIKKLLKKAGAEKVTKLDKKKYADFHAKLVALKG